MDQTLLTSLSAAWAAEDVKPAGPASAEAIGAFEHRYDISLPPDFRFYLQTLNGAEGGRGEMGNKHTISFWHLDEIEAEDVAGVRVFSFADFLIDSHRYAIALSSQPGDPAPVFLYYSQGSTLTRIADSFSDFVRAYIAGDEEVLHGARASRGPSA